MTFRALSMLSAAALIAACERQSVAPNPAFTNVVQSQAAAGYEAIDLGSLDAAIAVPTAISDDGVIVGTLSGFESHAGSRGFTYDDGVMRQLSYSGVGSNEAHALSRAATIAGQEEANQTLLVWDSPGAAPRRLDTGFPAFPQTRVVGLNERGEILTNVESGRPGRALLWRGDTPEDLGGLESAGSSRATFARAWNARGQVVGASRVRVDPPGIEIFHPFVWEAGAMQDICTGDCRRGEATDVNAGGVVVGQAIGELGFNRAFVWQNGVMEDLDVFPGQPTRAQAINNRGQILGASGGTVFVWDHGRLQTIEGNQVRAWALGQSGAVVGEMLNADFELHAFVWQDGVITDLGPGSARALNARGEIIGTNGFRAMLWRRANGS